MCVCEWLPTYKKLEAKNIQIFVNKPATEENRQRVALPDTGSYCQVLVLPFDYVLGLA